MTGDRLLLAKAGDGDFLRNVAEAVVQLLMEADGRCCRGQFGIWIAPPGMVSAHSNQDGFGGSDHAIEHVDCDGDLTLLAIG